MHSFNPISRSELQAIPIKHRLDVIRSYINHHVSPHVQREAMLGKTSYIFVIPSGVPDFFTTPQPDKYVITRSDIVEGLKEKFPDCVIEFAEEWVDVQPGIRQRRSGIRIDWS